MKILPVYDPAIAYSDLSHTFTLTPPRPPRNQKQAGCSSKLYMSRATQNMIKIKIKMIEVKTNMITIKIKMIKIKMKMIKIKIKLIKTKIKMINIKIKMIKIKIKMINVKSMTTEFSHFRVLKMYNFS